MNVADIKTLIGKGQVINRKIEKVKEIMPKDEWGIPFATVPAFQYFVSAEDFAMIHKSFEGELIYREEPLGEAWKEVEGVTFTALGVRRGDLE